MLAAALALWACAGAEAAGVRKLLSKLNTDVSAAMDGIALKDKDRKKLDAARQVVAEEAELQGARNRSERDKIRKALDQIEKAVRRDTFRAEDRKTVLEDIRQLRATPIGREPRPARAPRPRPFPRRLPRWLA